jgi:probable phosphoglycerate mutase
MLFVYLARHGETDWNAKRRIQGHTDVPLNEAGRDQARALVELLAKRKVGAVASSDLLRAKETASIVATALELGEPLLEKDLRERGLGVFEGLTREQLTTRFPREWEAYKRDNANTPPEGEPWPEFLDRIQGAVRRLARKLAKKQPAFVVTHGGVIKALLLASLDSPALITVPNGALFRFALDGEKLRRSPG